MTQSLPAPEGSVLPPAQSAALQALGQEPAERLALSQSEACEKPFPHAILNLYARLAKEGNGIRLSTKSR